MVGLAECILIGWVYGAPKFLRERSGNELGLWGKVFCVLIMGVIPLALLALLGMAAYDEIKTGLYGSALVDPASIGGDGGWRWLSTGVPLIWIGLTAGGAAVLTLLKGREAES
jgi:hypothetical protein